LHNNTISNNKAEGIYFEDNETLTDPNDKDWPDIQNCIVYYNNGGGIQLAAWDKIYLISNAARSITFAKSASCAFNCVCFENWDFGD